MSAVCCITPSSNKLITNSFVLGRTRPLISILLFGKNPLPNDSFVRLIVAGKFFKIFKKILSNQAWFQKSRRN